MKQDKASKIEAKIEKQKEKIKKLTMRLKTKENELKNLKRLNEKKEG